MGLVGKKISGKVKYVNQLRGILTIGTNAVIVEDDGCNTGTVKVKFVERICKDCKGNKKAFLVLVTWKNKFFNEKFDGIAVLNLDDESIEISVLVKVDVEFLVPFGQLPPGTLEDVEVDAKLVLKKTDCDKYDIASGNLQAKTDVIAPTYAFTSTLNSIVLSGSISH